MRHRLSNTLPSSPSLEACFLQLLVLLVAEVQRGVVVSTPVVEYDKGLRYEEYIVEHEISAGQARNSALSIDLNSVSSPPGCHKCSKSEMSYCLGRDLINDHCCCDKRYHEVLPFIPHTCYLGTQVCKPVVGDCAEYSRLRSCCCDKYVLQKWKMKAAGATSTPYKALLSISLMLVILSSLLSRYITLSQNN